MSQVEFSKRQVRIDGKPVQIVSGAMHYFRIPAELWEDRLTKAVQCGLNCVETYFSWNLHEPKEGNFDFSGMLDFERFLQIAQKLGLYVIARPGPYICAEWDNGGFPSWLMTKPGIRFRRRNAPYLDAVRKYFDVLLPKLKKYQYDDGGPIIAMQVENEYGSYGHDREYLKILHQMYLDAGITVPCFTADGAWEICLLGGCTDEMPVALTFGSNGMAAFDLGRKWSPDSPPFCMEFWCGWFDHWCEDGKRTHTTRSAESVADDVDDMLHEGGSVNLYMFHGGTNFGFMAGANGGADSEYMPDVTSYDYDGPLSESGDPTPKYFALQNVLKKYFPDRAYGTPVPTRKKAYGKVFYKQVAPLFANLDNLSKPVMTDDPETMEALGQDHGFIHYRTHIEGPLAGGDLVLRGVRDYAHIFLDGKLFHKYYRNNKTNYTPVFTIPGEGITVDILVENMGRINYGEMLGLDFKGITRGIGIGNQFRFGWKTWCLPMDDLSGLKWQDFTENLNGTPAFYRAELITDDPADTFVEFPGTKGIVIVNGHNLGRYWNVGPGSTLYLPGVWLKKGVNEIIVFETESLAGGHHYLRLVDQPQLS